MGTGFLAPQGCGGQSGRGQTQLTWFGPSLAEPEADSESFIDVQGALGCDLVALNPWRWGRGGDSSSVLVLRGWNPNHSEALSPRVIWF